MITQDEIVWGVWIVLYGVFVYLGKRLDKRKGK